MKFGIVLGGGGLTGEAFHRGVLRAMQDVGLDPRTADVVLGTSAGSLVGASLRRHAPRRQPAPACRPRRRLPGPGHVLDLVRLPRQFVNGALLWPPFLTNRHDNTFIREGLRRVHGDDWPASALWVTAVRRRDGRRVVFGRGNAPRADVGSAVAASCAVPGIFTPVQIDGAAYVDGGVHSPTNADLLADCDLDIAVVSSPMSVDLKSVRSAVDLPLRMWWNHVLREELWVMRRRPTKVVTIEPDRSTLQVSGLNALNARRIDEIEDRAYRHARRRLAAELGVPAEDTPPVRAPESRPTRQVRRTPAPRHRPRPVRTPTRAALHPGTPRQRTTNHHHAGT